MENLKQELKLEIARLEDTILKYESSTTFYSQENLISLKARKEAFQEILNKMEEK